MEEKNCEVSLVSLRRAVVRKLLSLIFLLLFKTRKRYLKSKW